MLCVVFVCTAPSFNQQYFLRGTITLPYGAYGAPGGSRLSAFPPHALTLLLLCVVCGMCVACVCLCVRADNIVEPYQVWFDGINQKQKVEYYNGLDTCVSSPFPAVVSPLPLQPPKCVPFRLPRGALFNDCCARASVCAHVFVLPTCVCVHFALILFCFTVFMFHPFRVFPFFSLLPATSPTSRLAPCGKSCRWTAPTRASRRTASRR